MKRTCLFIILFLIIGNFVAGEELHIDNEGNFRIESSPVASTNNNFLIVSVWGTKWNVFIDVGAKVMGADELDLNFTNIKTGHLLNVEGKFSEQFKYIDARKITDISVGTPKPKIIEPVIGASVSLSQVVTPPFVSPPVSSEQNTTSILESKAVIKVTKFLKIYMTDPEVKFLQKYLSQGGFLKSENITGYFGWVTKAAVQAFQKARGLEPLGVVGPQTRAVINGLPVIKSAVSNLPVSNQVKVVASSLISEDSDKKLTLFLKLTYRGGEVKILQNFLVSQGLLPAENVSGVFGPATESAVKAFQKSQGIEETGMVGPTTRVAINQKLTSGN